MLLKISMSWEMHTPEQWNVNANGRDVYYWKVEVITLSYCFM